jgi:hypothetical protein
MSAPPLSRIIRFLLIAAGLIILFSILWNFIDAAYTGFLTGIARAVVAEGATVEQKGGTIVFTHYIPYMGGSLQVFDSIVASAIQFGLSSLIGSGCSYPGLTLKETPSLSLAAVAVTFSLQLLSIVIMARTFSSIFFVIVSDVFHPSYGSLFAEIRLVKPAVLQPQPERNSPPFLLKSTKVV